MNPKDHARELINFYMPTERMFSQSKKQEISKKISLLFVQEVDNHLIETCSPLDPYDNLMEIEYWQEVKMELEII